MDFALCAGKDCAADFEIQHFFVFSCITGPGNHLESTTGSIIFFNSGAGFGGFQVDGHFIHSFCCVRNGEIATLQSWNVWKPG